MGKALAPMICLAACISRGPSRSATPNAPAPSRPTQSAQLSMPVESHGTSAPLDVSWVSVQVSDTHAVLRAHVERHARNLPSLTLSVTPPSSVRIMRGTSPVVLADGAPQSVTEYEYEFTFAQTPSGDILLSVDGDTESMGVHSRAWYRFGRPEPTGPLPQPSGPPLVIGGRNYGSPIRADVPAQVDVQSRKGIGRGLAGVSPSQ